MQTDGGVEMADKCNHGSIGSRGEGLQCLICGEDMSHILVDERKRQAKRLHQAAAWDEMFLTGDGCTHFKRSPKSQWVTLSELEWAPIVETIDRLETEIENLHQTISFLSCRAIKEAQP